MDAASVEHLLDGGGGDEVLTCDSNEFKVAALRFKPEGLRGEAALQNYLAGLLQAKRLIATEVSVQISVPYMRVFGHVVEKTWDRQGPNGVFLVTKKN